MENNLILVSNWEKVEENDFYLTKDWEKEVDVDREDIEKARELQKSGKLYVGYIVDAKNYAIYSQMDSSQVFINLDGDVILRCESAIISNDHRHRQDYEY